MLHKFIRTFIILLLLSPPVQAETALSQTKDDDKKPNVSLYIPPEAAEAEAIYAGLFKNLTKDQQEIIKAYESEYAKTSDIELEVASMALKIKYCAEKDPSFAKNIGKHNSGFRTYRNQLQVRLRDERLKIRARQIKETEFMDPKIMDMHFAYTSNIVFQVGFQIIKMNYEKGQFSEADCAAVAERLETAAREGNLISGRIDVTPAKVQEIQRLAKNGDAAGMYLLGMLQLTGSGVAKDLRGGLLMLKKSADKGHEPAQFTLGVGLTTDMFGQPPDIQEARYWLEKSAAQGNEKATAALKQLDQK